MSMDDIIKAKDLQISELLAEIHLLKENAQKSKIDNLDDLEITIDSNEITESIQLKTFSEEEEGGEGEGEEGGEDIMKLLSTFMNNNDASGNPLGASDNPMANIIQQMMGGASDNPMASIIQQMMGGASDNPMASIIQQMMSATNEDTSKDL
jgi:hypothetical protein